MTEAPIQSYPSRKSLHECIVNTIDQGPRYMTAETWNDLAKAATQSSTTDPVIQLVREGNSEPAYAPEGVKQRVFRDTFTLFLAYAASPLVKVALKSKLRASAKPFVPQILRSTSLQPEGDTISVNHVQDPSQAETQHLPTKFLDVSNLEDPFTDNERDAARKIQAFYRRFSRRMKSRSKPDPVEHWFKECLAISVSLQLSRPYRATFLGPFPHFLLCVDAFRRHQENQRIYASKHARIVDQSNLENATEQLAKIR